VPAEYETVFAASLSGTAAICQENSARAAEMNTGRESIFTSVERECLFVGCCRLRVLMIDWRNFWSLFMLLFLSLALGVMRRNPMFRLTHFAQPCGSAI
jgi:hypothetical protein